MKFKVEGWLQLKITIDRVIDADTAEDACNRILEAIEGRSDSRVDVSDCEIQALPIAPAKAATTTVRIETKET